MKLLDICNKIHLWIRNLRHLQLIYHLFESNINDNSLDHLLHSRPDDLIWLDIRRCWTTWMMHFTCLERSWKHPNGVLGDSEQHCWLPKFLSWTLRPSISILADIPPLFFHRLSAKFCVSGFPTQEPYPAPGGHLAGPLLLSRALDNFSLIPQGVSASCFKPALPHI